MGTRALQAKDKKASNLSNGFDTQHQAAAHEASQQQDRFDAELQFIDNRVETSGLQQLQKVADNSPRVTAQRKQIESSFGMPVQRKEVTVAGGVFKDDCGDGYIAYNVNNEGGYDERGGQMSQLEFQPTTKVTNKSGERAKEIALIQTTNSTVRHKVGVDDAEDQPESLLNERRTDAGTAIDQQIYLDPKLNSEKLDLQLGRLRPLVAAMKGKGNEPATNAHILAFEVKIAEHGYQKINSIKQSILQTKLDNILKAENGNPSEAVATNVPLAKTVVKQSRKKVNLDPRYAEERKSDQDAMKTSEVSGTLAHGTTGWNATRTNGTDAWPGAAVLRDQPSHKVVTGTELIGREEFEVAAMADGEKFVGSIKWGWKIDGTVAELLHPFIAKVSNGEASGEFYEAAKAWNDMKVPDVDGEELSTIQLPTKPV